MKFILRRGPQHNPGHTQCNDRRDQSQAGVCYELMSTVSQWASDLQGLAHDAGHDGTDTQGLHRVQRAQGGFQLVQRDQPGADGWSRRAQEIQLPGGKMNAIKHHEKARKEIAVTAHGSCARTHLHVAGAGERTLVGAAQLNQTSLMVSFMLLESGGGGTSGRFFRLSDSTPSSCRGGVPQGQTCVSLRSRNA